MEEGTANITAKSQTNPDVLPSPTLTKENISESASNVMMDDVSRAHDASNATNAAWVKKKEFLKLNHQCQNKEKINHAIEKLVESCPNQVNVIKRLVEYIQEDINRMIRLSNTNYASNTSIGSTNNLLGTPGGGMF